MTEEKKLEESKEKAEVKEKAPEKVESKEAVEKTPEKTTGKENEKSEENTEKEVEKAEEAKVEETKKEAPKEEKPRRRKDRFKKTRKDIEEDIAGWEPKTSLGRDVKENKITSLDHILDNDMKILEEQIVDKLLELDSELSAIGQSKGKFGGGKRRAWKQTQRKTKEGNVPTFAAMAVVGDRNGHVGIGKGRASETLPARDKATKKAKKNIIKVGRKCSAFDCDCDELHTIPYQVTGKSGSVRLTLIPAPQGTGLVAGEEVKKVLELAGIKDIYSKTFGQSKVTFNFVKACIDALKKTHDNPKPSKEKASPKKEKTEVKEDEASSNLENGGTK